MDFGKKSHIMVIFAHIIFACFFEKSVYATIFYQTQRFAYYRAPNMNYFLYFWLHVMDFTKGDAHQVKKNISTRRASHGSNIIPKGFFPKQQL